MKETRGSKETVKCKRCKVEFEARVADIKRGWGKFCSKSCKAVRQEQRTGQMSNYLSKVAKRKFDYDNFDPHDHDHGAWESEREDK